MYLKPGCDIAAFVSCVRSCKGDVYFETTEGDSLNLKSTLSQYLFTSISGNVSFLSQGQVNCKFESDYELLSSYLQSGRE